jgi:hypothetical protein
MSDPAPLPTFLVIGAQKSATRWLKANLAEHPDVHVAPREVGYFHDPDRVRDGGPGWYRAQFHGWRGERAVGEGTPGYMIWHHRPADVAARIQELVPDVRLVAILRDPVERARSALDHFKKWGDVEPDADLMALVRAERDAGHLRPEPPASNVRGWGGPQTLVTGGWYAASLAPYLERFGDHLLVVLDDDVAADPRDVHRRVLEHLGVDPGHAPSTLRRTLFSNVAPRRLRRSPRRPPLADADRAELFELFRDDVDRLEVMIGRDLGAWRPG